MIGLSFFMAAPKPHILPLSKADWLRGLPWLILIEIVYLAPYGDPTAGGLAKKYIWDESTVSHNYPISYLARQEVQDGFFPLWNHMTGMGIPLLADPQNETALPWDAFKHLLPFPLGYNLYFACRLFIILTGCFALGRSLGARRSGAIVLAAVFSFTGFISFLMNGGIASIYLLPWSVFAFHRLARKPELKWVLLLGLSFGLALLGGNPQYPIHALVIGFGLYLAALIGKKEPFSLGRYLILPSLGVVMGALLAAPQILPFLELAPRLFTHHGANYGLLHLDPRGIVSILSPLWSPAVFAMTSQGMNPIEPYILARLDPQTWADMTLPLPFEHIGFAGGLGLILVILSLKRQKLEAAYFALAALVSLGVAFGLFPFNLIGRVPPFSVISNFRYSCFTAAFAAACCAALTLPELHLARMKKLIAPALAVLLFIALSGMALVASQAGLPLSAPFIKLAALGVGLVFFFLSALSLKRPKWLALLAVLEMLAYDRITDRRLFPHPLVMPNAPMGPVCPGRDPAFRHTAVGKMFRPNLGILCGASDLRSFEPFLLKDYAQWVMSLNHWDEKATLIFFLQNYFLAPEPDALLSPETAAASVKWLQYDADQPRDGQNAARFESVWRPVPASSRALCFENNNALPRLRVAGKPGAVKEVEWGSNRISARVEGEGTLVLADNYYPGWKAYVDGQETRVNRAEKIFRSIEVPAGTHKIIFRYEPVPFRIGLWAGLAAWAALAFAAIKRRKISS
jgi:hypothetical protein